MRARRAGTQWRVAARLARREVRRRPGRTTLVLLLVGLPVAGMTLYVIGARTTTPTDEELRTWRLGQADDVVFAPSGDDYGPDAAAFDQALAAAYPPGSRFVTYTKVSDAVTRDDGHLERITVTNPPIDDPLLAGTMPLLEGRAPRTADEVALDQTLAGLADAEVGSTVELYLLGDKEVSGIVADPLCATSCPTVVATGPLTALPILSRHAFVDAPPGFVASNAAPLAAIQADPEINPSGRPDFYASAELPERQFAIYMVGVVVLALITVITVAAFAVATRRQLRTLGLLSASGVPPSGLRRVVLLQGTSAGVVGSGLGVLLGLGLAQALHPLFDDVSEQYVTGLDVHPLDLLGPFVLGVVAATAAAWWPARTAARIPTLAALGGRQPQDRPQPRRPLVGLVLMGSGVAGLAWSVRSAHPRSWVDAVAAVALLLGGVAMGPWLVSHAEPLSRMLRGGARVALRDLARQRVRSGAVVAAIMAPAGVLALAVTTSATQDARNRASYLIDTSTPFELQDDQVALEPPGGWATGQTAPEAQRDQLMEILGDAVAVDVHVVLPQQPTTTEFPGATLQIVDPATGQAVPDGMDGAGRYLVTLDPVRLAEIDADPEMVAALEQGKIVVTGVRVGDPGFVLDGITTPVDVAADVVVIDDLPGRRMDQIASVSPATAAAWGASTLYYGTVYQTPEPLTRSQRGALEELSTGADCDGVRDPAACRDKQLRADLRGQPLPADDENWWVQVRPGQTDLHDQQLARYGYSAALLVFTLLVLAVALALTAAESRDERALLDAVGAPPAVRQSIAAWQAGLLPAIAMVVAIPCGVVVARATDPYGWEAGDPFVIPWLELAACALGIPLVAAAAAWLASSVSGLRRRDLSGPALAAD